MRQTLQAEQPPCGDRESNDSRVPAKHVHQRVIDQRPSALEKATQ